MFPTVASQKTSAWLYLWSRFIFVYFITFFFYTQIAFDFHPLGDFYVVYNHIIALFFYTIQSDLDAFHETFFEALFWIISAWQIFVYEKKVFFKKKWLIKWFKAFTILLLKFFQNHFKITQIIFAGDIF